MAIVNDSKQIYNNVELNDSFNKRGNEDNDHEKTYYTVNSESFNDKDFHEFLNCLDNIRETTLKRRTNDRVIKNYCVQIPYIDNSIQLNESDELIDQKVDEKCDEMRNNISQMFSYFDEEIDLDLMDDKEEEIAKPLLLENSPIKIITSKELNKFDHNSQMKSNVSKVEENFDTEQMDDSYDDFRAKFVKNRSIIEQFQIPFVDTKPVIKGFIKKPNVRTPSQSINNSLNKNQVDKIMNEFNRVKINYYSKDNFVEFTNIDYFYTHTESDISTFSSVVSDLSKLETSILPTVPPTIVVNRMQQFDQEAPCIPKNCVKDKINLFSKMDMIIKPISNKNNMMPIPMSKNYLPKDSPVVKEKVQMKPNMNISCVNKNQNKCFIKDINNSLLHETEKSPNDDLKVSEVPEKHLNTEESFNDEFKSSKVPEKHLNPEKSIKDELKVPQDPEKHLITEESFNEEFKVPKVPEKYLNTEKSLKDEFKVPKVPEKYLTLPLDTPKNVLFEQQKSYETLEHILDCVPLTDTVLLLNLEQIVNQFNVSLLHTINGLIHDQAFALQTSESKIAKISIQTQPSIDKFNEQFLNESHDGVSNDQLEFIDLRVIQSNAIQLQIHIKPISCVTNLMKLMQINVIFKAKFLPTDTKTNELIVENANEVPEGTDNDVFFIYFTSFFEVHFTISYY